MSTVKQHPDTRQVRRAVCGKMFTMGQTRDARVLRPGVVEVIISDEPAQG